MATSGQRRSRRTPRRRPRKPVRRGDIRDEEEPRRLLEELRHLGEHEPPSRSGLTPKHETARLALPLSASDAVTAIAKTFQFPNEDSCAQYLYRHGAKGLPAIRKR